jgi:hypothetical protein
MSKELTRALWKAFQCLDARIMLQKGIIEELKEELQNYRNGEELANGTLHTTHGDEGTFAGSNEQHEVSTSQD